MFKHALASVFFSLVLFGTSSCQAQPDQSLIHDNDRIVFVGDSITGQGGNAGQGWTHLMEEALRATHPNGAPTLIPLGGSGQTVGSWQGIEENSRSNSVTLDVRGIDVKETLDKPADVLVIMLGMNDLLSPSLGNNDADFDAWAGRYRALLGALKARVHPRLVALATIPVCTEDENSPKNKVSAALALRLNDIAKTENAVVLPVHPSQLRMLARGRTLRPDFHVTVDMVHPNDAGHLAIAEGMLEGLAEPRAVQYLASKYWANVLNQPAVELPALSYTVEYLPAALTTNTQSCKISYWWTTSPTGESDNTARPKITLTSPQGWQIKEQKLSAVHGVYTVTGPFDRSENVFTLQGSMGTLSRKTEVKLPAP